MIGTKDSMKNAKYQNFAGALATSFNRDWRKSEVEMVLVGRFEGKHMPGSKKRGRRRDVSDRCASECALNPRPTWTRIYEVEANGKKKTRRKGNSRVSWPYRVNPSNIHNETRDYKSIRNSRTFHLLQIYFVYDYLFENEYKEKIWILFSCESQLLSKDRCNYLYEKFYDFIRLFILIEWSKRWKLKIHDI